MGIKAAAKKADPDLEEQKAVPGKKAKGGPEQPGPTFKQIEAAIKWPAPGEDQAWERETSSLDRPGAQKRPYPGE